MEKKVRGRHSRTDSNSTNYFNIRLVLLFFLLSLLLLRLLLLPLSLPFPLLLFLLLLLTPRLPAIPQNLLDPPVLRLPHRHQLPLEPLPPRLQSLLLLLLSLDAPLHTLDALPVVHVEAGQLAGEGGDGGGVGGELAGVLAEGDLDGFGGRGEVVWVVGVAFGATARHCC